MSDRLDQKERERRRNAAREGRMNNSGNLGCVGVSRGQDLDVILEHAKGEQVVSAICSNSVLRSAHGFEMMLEGSK